MELNQADRMLLERLEEELWRDRTRMNRGRMELLLAPDFFEFGRSGRIYERRDILDAVIEPIEARFPLANFRARLLVADVAQVTYDSVAKYDRTVLHGRRSSIWSRAATGWILRFHQGTPYDGDG